VLGGSSLLPTKQQKTATNGQFLGLGYIISYMKKIYYIFFIVIALACFRVEPVSAYIVYQSLDTPLETQFCNDGTDGWSNCSAGVGYADNDFATTSSFDSYLNMGPTDFSSFNIPSVAVLDEIIYTVHASSSYAFKSKLCLNSCGGSSESDLLTWTPLSVGPYYYQFVFDSSVFSSSEWTTLQEDLFADNWRFRISRTTGSQTLFIDSITATYFYHYDTEDIGGGTATSTLNSKSFLEITYPINGSSINEESSELTFNLAYRGYRDSSDNQSAEADLILGQFCPMDTATDSWAIDNNADCEKFTVASSTVADQLFNGTKEITLDSNGYYLGMINFWNGVSEEISCSWWEPWCEPTSIIVGKGDSVRFNIASTTIYHIPSVQLNAIDNLLHKAPWGYITLISDMWVDVSNATATATPNLTIVMPTSNTVFSGKSLTLWDWSYAKDLLETNTFDLINDFIVIVLWAGFVFYLLKRLKSLISI